jgi:arsenate reductase
MDTHQGTLFDLAVTVCDKAKEICPICGVNIRAPPHTTAAKKTIHRSFRDPAAAEGSEEEQLAVFRQIRDEIKDWINETFR